MLALRPERGLLKPGVPPELIATTRRRVALGFVIYLVATGLAAVNAYLGLGIMTAMWVFWATFAYRALNRREHWSADAVGGSEDDPARLDRSFTVEPVRSKQPTIEGVGSMEAMAIPIKPGKFEHGSRGAAS